MLRTIVGTLRCSNTGVLFVIASFLAKQRKYCFLLRYANWNENVGESEIRGEKMFFHVYQNNKQFHGNKILSREKRKYIIGVMGDYNSSIKNVWCTWTPHQMNRFQQDCTKSHQLWTEGKVFKVLFLHKIECWGQNVTTFFIFMIYFSDCVVWREKVSPPIWCNVPLAVTTDMKSHCRILSGSSQKLLHRLFFFCLHW